MPVRVTVVSDFICPWCYIGKARLSAALADLGDAVPAQVHWRPFELNPDLPPGGIDRRTYRTQKFGSWERSLKLDAQVIEAAAGDGIVFDYDRQPRTPNTRAAHRLVWLAQHAVDATPLADAIFRAYFTEGRDIGRHEELAAIAGDIGYEADQVLGFLASGDGAEAVHESELQATASGIDGVPYVLIDREALVGAHPAVSYRDALLRAAGRAAAEALAD